MLQTDHTSQTHSALQVRHVREVLAVHTLQLIMIVLEQVCRNACTAQIACITTGALQATLIGTNARQLVKQTRNTQHIDNNATTGNRLHERLHQALPTDHRAITNVQCRLHVRIVSLWFQRGTFQDQLVMREHTTGNKQHAGNKVQKEVIMSREHYGNARHASAACWQQQLTFASSSFFDISVSLLCHTVTSHLWQNSLLLRN